MKYSIGIDIGLNDDTVAILMLFVGGRMYVLAEKGTSMIGENKLTQVMKEKITKVEKAYKQDLIDKDTLSYAISKILQWEEFNAEVFIN